MSGADAPLYGQKRGVWEEQMLLHGQRGEVWVEQTLLFMVREEEFERNRRSSQYEKRWRFVGADAPLRTKRGRVWAEQMPLSM